MTITSSKTGSIIYIIQKKIDSISFRIKAIQKSYDQINNANLKLRLLKEYENLKINFIEIKSLVRFIDHSSSSKLSISKILNEKCNRCENEIFKNKYLFSA